MSKRTFTFEDLRAYITLLEEAGGRGFKRTTNGYLGCAAHRVDRTPSLGVFIGSGGGIVVHDHAWKKSWSAYNYLKEALGREDLAQRWLEMTREWDPTKERSQAPRKRYRHNSVKSRPELPRGEVSYTNVQPATDEWEATARAKMEEALMAIENGEHPETLRYMEKRGLKPEYAYAAGLGALKEGIAIPVYDEDIRMKNVKVRRHEESKGGRFFYVFSDRGNGYYFSPDFAWKPMQRVIIVEGETNAAAVYVALGVPTIGVPGASTGLSRKLAERLKEYAAEVVVMTDQDDAGRQLMERIKAQLVAVGYDRQRIFIPVEDRYHRDPMDILKDHGLDYLRENLKERIYNRGSSLKRGGSSAGNGIALAASLKHEGLNTKRSLLMATGHEMVRRHAKYIPPEQLEAVASVENFITRELMWRQVEPVKARKAARKWMVERRITPLTALFLTYEANDVDTGASEELRNTFAYQRKQHPFTTKYRYYDEDGRVRFDIEKLLEDAVNEAMEIVEEVVAFFKKLAERVNAEREEFAKWMAGLPHLLKHILRRAVGGSPPVAAAA
jgi:5S rRNA maturation endonuclease (ribonuclease M5)